MGLADILRKETARTTESRFLHRLHALVLIERGLSCRAVAKMLGDSPRTVAHWLHRFRTIGLNGLRDTPVSGRPPRLTFEQVDAIREHLRQTNCSGRCLVGWIEETYQVRLSVRQCQRLIAAQRVLSRSA